MSEEMKKLIMTETHSSRPDRIATLTTWGTALMISGLFVWLLGSTLYQGYSELSWNYLLTEPMNAGREGGIGPILMSTSLILLVCMTVSFPLGLGAAIYLAEWTTTQNRGSRVIRHSLDMLAGVPSIVFGLFGNAFFCVWLNMGFSILSGGLTLACMVLPLLIRSTEEGLRSVPQEYRVTAAALGLRRISTLRHILLPAAMPGLLVGFVLGVGRAIAETAALIFTSGYVDRMPESLWDSGRALSIHIYDLSMNVPGGDAKAHASALTLIMILIMINSLSTWVGTHWASRHLKIA
jgi:phosphate transport system permease protein